MLFGYVILGDISGCVHQLRIERVSDDNFLDVAHYVVNQQRGAHGSLFGCSVSGHDNVFGYVTNQSEYVRCGYSGNWIYRGWRKDFDRLRFVCSHLDFYPNCKLSADFWKEWCIWLSSLSIIQSSLDMWMFKDL